MPTQTAGPDPFGIVALVRKLIPFTHRPFRSGQKDGPGQQLTCTFGAPNTPVAFTHSLGRVPAQWVVTGQLAGGSIFASNTNKGTWTSTSVTFQSSSATTYNVVLF